MLWICENGHVFQWVRHGEATKPDKCLICGSTKIEG